MKIINAIIAISLLFAGVAFADSISYNVQKQDQALGGMSLGYHGGISAIAQHQEGLGFSASQPGSTGAEGQVQYEAINHSFTNPATTHTYNSQTMTGGFSKTSKTYGGLAVHAESADVKSGTLTVGDAAGTFSASGSGTKVNNASASASTYKSKAGTFANTKYVNSYKYDNVGLTSNIHQEGVSYGDVGTRTHTKGGIAGATATGTQVGATTAANNGVGTSMAGSSMSAGTATVDTGFLGNANAKGHVNQGQYHAYSQEAVGTGTYQSASGYTATTNTAH